MSLPTMLELPVPAPLIQIMLGADFYFQKHGTEVRAPRAALWGPSSGWTVSRTEGRLHVLVVVLTCRGAAALGATGLSLADQQILLEDLVAPTSWRRLESVGEAADLDSRVLQIEAGLREVFRASPDAGAAAMMVDAVLQHNLRGTVGDMAEFAGISARAVHKRCRNIVGWSPKRLLRVTRLQRVLGLVHPSPWLPRSEVFDARLEYADDSHLANDVKGLTGLSLSSYRAAKLRSGDSLVHTMIDLS